MADLNVMLRQKLDTIRADIAALTKREAAIVLLLDAPATIEPEPQPQPAANVSPIAEMMVRRSKAKRVATAKGPSPLPKTLRVTTRGVKIDLKPSELADIRSMAEAGIPRPKIGEKYGLKRGVLANIINGKGAWA